ncbi:MAG: plasmid mobilization protein, partial [Bacteroidales bacterium]
KGKKKLSIPINLKLTLKDYNSVKQKAENLGMTPTEYARELTLKGSVKSRFTLEELDLIRQLAGMANNLNQIAKRANIAGFRDVYSETMGMVEYFKQLLDDR